jgi:hypothetical protein
MDRSAEDLRGASYALFEAAREAGQYEVAYHALAALLHAAEALARGHESIFRQLAVTAASARLRMEADAVYQKAKGRPKAPFAHGKS